MVTLDPFIPQSHGLHTVLNLGSYFCFLLPTVLKGLISSWRRPPPRIISSIYLALVWASQPCRVLRTIGNGRQMKIKMIKPSVNVRTITVDSNCLQCVLSSLESSCWRVVCKESALRSAFSQSFSRYCRNSSGWAFYLREKLARALFSEMGSKWGELMTQGSNMMSCSESEEFLATWSITYWRVTIWTRVLAVAVS
jgi:hypothetical protein